MSKIVPLFSTPVIKINFSKHAKYAGMFDTWDKVDRKPSNWLVPLNTSFPLIQDDDPYVNQETRDSLKEDIMFDIRRTLLKYNIPTKVEYECFWYNAYRKGQGQEVHNHLSMHNDQNPLWSGVYFAQNCDPGSFFFANHDFAWRTQQQFPYVKSNLSEYYKEFMPMNFIDGDIVLFPPHLNHGVKCGNLKEDVQRLTFSFNIYLEKKKC